jgi:hypothetical protein
MRIRAFATQSLAVLAVGALTLTMEAADRFPIEQSLKVKGALVFTVSQDSQSFGEAVVIGQGTSSHLGKIEINALGSFDLDSGDFVGEGVVTAANGDLLYFKMRDLGWIQFIGGTGHFINTTGELAIEPTAPPKQLDVGGQLIIAFRFTGQGAISYSNRPPLQDKRLRLDQLSPF